MKKIITLLLVIALAVSCAVALVACDTDEYTISELVVVYVPSREADEILEMTAALGGLLTTELAKHGYTVKKVTVEVSTSYEAAGLALVAGTADIGLLPGGTYIAYDDGCEVILTATRDGLSKDFADAASWNDDGPTYQLSTVSAVYYRSLIITGPSTYGQYLADKINSGEDLTWEDLNGAQWSVGSSTSSASYVYPTLWLTENYGKTLSDLDNCVTDQDYATNIAALQAGTIDVTCIYADARNDYYDTWEVGSEYETSSIWTETAVIGVTDGIYNDTVCVTSDKTAVSDELAEAIAASFISIGESEEGADIIAVYSHTGYQLATSADYDGARAAAEFLASLS